MINEIFEGPENKKIREENFFFKMRPEIVQNFKVWRLLFNFFQIFLKVLAKFRIIEVSASRKLH